MSESEKAQRRSCDAGEPSAQCAFSERKTHEAAEQAVRKVFAILGVNVDSPESVESFREDLRFGRRMRRAADHGLLALMGVIVAAVAAAVWAGIASRLNGH